jgi:dihydrodipicolinate synthase/N-acetylneuraminate lyase
MERAIRVYERLKGPIVPVNLCFKSDDSLDYVAIKKYVGWLCEQKVPVILLTMGSSEMYNLTDEEIWRLTEELAAEIAGRSLFIASTNFWCISQCREFLKYADSVGVDAVKVQISTFFPTTREVIVGYFDRIID